MNMIIKQLSSQEGSKCPKCIIISGTKSLFMTDQIKYIQYYEWYGKVFRCCLKTSTAVACENEPLSVVSNIHSFCSFLSML